MPWVIRLKHMDDPPVPTRIARMLTPDGFPGERFRVLPAPLVTRALSAAVTSRLLVTDAGHFPRASGHGRQRIRGAREAIVILCLDGLGSCEVDGRTITVRPGTALVIAPGTPHLYRADAEHPWTIWWLHVAGQDVEHLLGPILRERRAQLVEVHDLFRTTATVERVVDLMERDETRASLLATSGAAWSLLAELAADQEHGPSGAREPVQQALAHLREHIAAPVAVPELARMAGLSRSQFTTLFRQATGQGVVAYLRSLRMARARSLLVTTSLSIADIGAAVGYPDQFYFSRQFRRVHGCSPSDYRGQSLAESVSPN